MPSSIPMMRQRTGIREDGAGAFETMRHPGYFHLTHP
jgi:hypothetical protein